MFICRNTEGVHAYLSKCRRGTCSGGFKVEGARGETKKGGPSDDVIILSQP